MAAAGRRDSDSTVADVYEHNNDFQLFSVVSKLGKSVKMQFETLVNVFRSATGTGRCCFSRLVGTDVLEKEKLPLAR